MSQILPYETRSTVPFVLMTDRCWQIGNRNARRHARGTIVRIVKRTIKRILSRLVGRWQIAYRLVGRRAGTGFHPHQSPALHVLAVHFRLPADLHRSESWQLISDMSICVACCRRTCHMLGRLAKASAIWSRAVSEADYEALWPAGFDRHEKATVKSCCDEGDRQCGRPDLRSSTQQPSGKLTPTLSKALSS